MDAFCQYRRNQLCNTGWSGSWLPLNDLRSKLRPVFAYNQRQVALMESLLPARLLPEDMLKAPVFRKVPYRCRNRFIDNAIHKTRRTISVLRIISKHSNGSIKTGSSADTDSFAPVSGRWCCGTLTAGFCTTGLPVCVVITVVMNIYRPTHAKGVIFVHPAIRSVRWSSVSSFVRRWWRPYRIGMWCWAYRKFCSGIFFTTASRFRISVVVDGRRWKLFYTTGVRDPKAVPSAVVAIQIFGDFLGFHPHLHILVSDGCFQKNGMFSVSPAVDTEALEQIFRSKVPSWQ